MLTTRQSDGTVLTIRPASRASPVGYCGPYAFARLATALGSSLVPPTEVHAVPLRDLLSILNHTEGARPALIDALSVRNDGTIVVLVQHVPARTKLLALGRSPEVSRWRAWAESSKASPSAERPLVGAYVETLMLDYLSGNPGRSSILVEEASHRPILSDNDLAFAEFPSGPSLDGLLAALRRVVRFPRTLTNGLRALDRAVAHDILRTPTGEPLPHRLVLQMLERKKTLLSLVDVRTLEVGDDALALP